MDEMRIFENEEFGSVRTVVIDGEPYFVGKDVAEILGYKNSSKALADHVDDEDKLNNDSLLSLGQRGGWLINESGLYSLILSSKLPTVKKFKRWVTSEVLPSIRKNGGYISGQEIMSDDEIMAKALVVAQKKISAKDAVIKMQEQKINEDTPKVLFADAVSTSNTTILIGELAKILKGNGIEIGQNRLFSELRNNGFLVKRKGTDYNTPTQSAMEMGLFKVKETAVTHYDGHITICKTTKVTPKGQQYFINHYLSNLTA